MLNKGKRGMGISLCVCLCVIIIIIGIIFTKTFTNPFQKLKCAEIKIYITWKTNLKI